MIFIATKNSKLICNFQQAVSGTQNFRQDGVFVPSFLPSLTMQQIDKLCKLTYQEILIEIIHIMCDKSIDKNILNEIVNDAFKYFNRGFGSNSPIDIKTNSDVFTMQDFSDIFKIANLTHGPTGCCKDYGHCLTASFLNYFAKKEGKPCSVVEASDGISGPSISWAIKDKDYLNCFIILKNGCDPSCKALMTQATRNSNNIKYISVDSDQNFINEIRYNIENNLSLIDISNTACIKGQNILNVLAYLPVFFKIYANLNYVPFCVSIPTNNMTMAMAGFFAKKLGIRIKKIVLATEKNDFLINMQQKQVFVNNNNVEESCTTFDANIPSNLERLLFYLYNTNQASVKRLMQELTKSGKCDVSNALLVAFNELFYVSKGNNQFSIRKNISSLTKEKNMYVGQHFALAKICAEQALEKITDDVRGCPIVLFNTLDFRRNINFINTSLGYTIEHIQYPWNDDDIKLFSNDEIKANITEVLHYIVSCFDDNKKN